MNRPHAGSNKSDETGGEISEFHMGDVWKQVREREREREKRFDSNIFAEA